METSESPSWFRGIAGAHTRSNGWEPISEPLLDEGADDTAWPTLTGLRDASTVEDALTSGERLEALIHDVADHVERYYVLAERASELAVLVRAEASDAASTVEELAQWLTTRLRAETDDFHFRFEERTFSDAERDAEPQHRWKQTPPDPTANFGFRSVSANSGIGTITITPYLVPPRWSAATAHAAFAFIRPARAVVVDLRECYGGDPELIAIIASYFLGPGDTELSSARWRDTGDVERLVASGDTVPFQFPGDTSVFVVVGPRTASGGEALAYDLQALGRAAVVGSSTLGAAHRIKQFQLGPLVATIPCGLVTNPITGTDWEESGVQPDIEAVPDDGLNRAIEVASRILVGMTPTRPTPTRSAAQADTRPSGP